MSQLIRSSLCIDSVDFQKRSQKRCRKQLSTLYPHVKNKIWCNCWTIGQSLDLKRGNSSRGHSYTFYNHHHPQTKENIPYLCLPVVLSQISGYLDDRNPSPVFISNVWALCVASFLCFWCGNQIGGGGGRDEGSFTARPISASHRGASDQPAARLCMWSRPPEHVQPDWARHVTLTVYITQLSQCTVILCKKANCLCDWVHRPENNRKHTRALHQNLHLWIKTNFLLWQNKLRSFSGNFVPFV